MAEVRDILTKRVVAEETDLRCFSLREVSECQFEINASSVDAEFLLILRKLIEGMEEEITDEMGL